MSTMSRSSQLDSALTDLLRQAPEVEAAAVVSFDGLPMASALPASMDEDRVAAMSAALLSLGERAAQGLGRGDLSQVYIEGENGTVFLVSADDEAVLVAVAARGAKVGMMLFEVRQAAAVVAAALRTEPEAVAESPVASEYVEPVAEPVHSEPVYSEPVYSEPVYPEPAYSAEPLAETAVAAEPYTQNGGGVADLSGWQSYTPGSALNGNGDSSTSWS
jgi:predicted regulator of Ras-like GTPase activity (Roadblock/LC7/MglB family)